VCFSICANDYIFISACSECTEPYQQQAAEIIREALEEKIKRYVEELEDVWQKLEKLKEGSVGVESYVRKIWMRETQIQMEKNVQWSIGIWGITIYKEGE
jgi:hypothetical protein